MTSSTELPKKPVFKNTFLSAFFGAAIPFVGLTTIILTKEDHLETWMLVPLIIIPAGGAFGAAFFHLMGFYWFPKGGQKLTAIIFSVILYFFLLWVSAVFAFSLTGHWN